MHCNPARFITSTDNFPVAGLCGKTRCLRRGLVAIAVSIASLAVIDGEQYREDRQTSMCLAQ